MINQNMNLKKYSVITIIFLIIISVIFYIQNQNNSVNQNITQNNIQNIEVQETKTKEELDIDEKSEISNFKESIITKVKKILPQEYSVVAEEILYPNEYDFGDMLDETVLLSVGKPIKLDVLPFSKAKIGDTIELELDGKSFNAEVFKFEEYNTQAEPGDNATGTITTVWFDSYLDPTIKTIRKNQIHGDISYDKNGVVTGEIRIQDKGGDYVIKIYKQVAYFALEQEWRAEFIKQGYTND